MGIESPRLKDSSEDRESLVHLEGFGAGFGDKVVLANVNLRIDGPGTHLLMGPCGSGKSTLLRTLAGLNDAHAAFRTWGQYHYVGDVVYRDGQRAATEQARPRLVRQKIRLALSTLRENLAAAMPDRGQLSVADQVHRIREVFVVLGMEQLSNQLDTAIASLPSVANRLVALASAYLSEQPVLLIDEPMTQLEDEQAAEILHSLTRIAERRALIVITHHRKRARQLGGQLHLLAGGRFQADGPAEIFFRPQVVEKHEFADRFMRSGGPYLPTKPPTHPPPPPTVIFPRQFCWLIEGELGGLPRPGVVDERSADLDGLGQLKVTTLVNLEEHQVVPLAEIEARGIEALHWPIVDMSVPPMKTLLEWLDALHQRIAHGEVIAVHCLAGLGRTGTMLAAYLVRHRGYAAASALERVRGLRRQMVQAEAQEQLLTQIPAA